MIHVDLQDALGLQAQLRLHRCEVFLHLEGHALAAGQAHRVGLEPGGCLHLVHLIPQCFLQEGKALLMAVGLVGLLLIAQLQIPVNGGAEGLVLICTQHVG